MSDRLLDKFTARVSPVRAADGEADDGVLENGGCFGWLRGIHARAIMLELRRKDGHILAVGNSWLERAEFDPQQGITLHLSDCAIRIEGSGLNSEIRPGVRLFEGIVRHRVAWIRECVRAEALGDSHSVIVERIQWDA